MTEQTIDVVTGRVVVTPSFSDDVPTAATKGASIGDARFRLVEGSRSATEEDHPRSLNPYWDITEYTSEEFKALLATDRLTPELAEQYKDLLED
jgi:hypothetical protein